ncbi:hypothetical protein P4O66_017557 [Electrophorus voltai]|uniref:Ig-like domain-containing protein n=1 Tax=Electrophorus voltai TaxID=2609070 RepID=A0AAD8YTE6_9TELE|nr:hypothetical protein P4O66_017557 [Electrophorus voltai]
MILSIFLTDLDGSDVLIETHVTGVLGEDVYLNCQYTGKDEIEYSSWNRMDSSKSSTRMAGFKYGRISFSKESFSSPASITNLTVKVHLDSLDMEGHYACVFSSDDWEWKESLFLTVLAQPDISTHVDDELVNGIPYQSVSCSASHGKPAGVISWRVRSGAPAGYMLPATSTNSTHPDGTTSVASLLRVPVHLNNESRVTCVVQHPAWSKPRTSDIQLQTFVFPTVNMEMRLTKKEGKDLVEVECRATGGRPHPDITWSLPSSTDAPPPQNCGQGLQSVASCWWFPTYLFEGENITCVFGYSVLSAAQTRTITLPTYHLRSLQLKRDSIGMNSENTSIVLTLEQGDRNIIIGMEILGNVPSYEISCSNLCVLLVHSVNAAVQFHLDGEPLSEDIAVVDSELSITGPVGTILAGQYQCQASYHKHTASLQFEIKVNPRILLPVSFPPNISVNLRKEADSIYVECLALDATPAANISWILPEDLNTTVKSDITSSNRSHSVRSVLTLPACWPQVLTVQCVVDHSDLADTERRELVFPPCVHARVMLISSRVWENGVAYAVVECRADNVTPDAAITWSMQCKRGLSALRSSRPQQRKGAQVWSSTRLSLLSYAGCTVTCSLDQDGQKGHNGKSIDIPLIGPSEIHVSVGPQRDPTLWAAVCKYRGDAVIPNISWVISDQNITTIRPRVHTNNENITVLATSAYEFRRHQHEDENLTCVIQNDYGEDMRKTIHVPKYFISSIAVLNNTVALRESRGQQPALHRVTLQPAIPQQRVLFRVYGNTPEYKFTCFRADGSAADTVATALFFAKPVSERDAGMYMCHASWKQHKASIFVQVDVTSQETSIFMSASKRDRTKLRPEFSTKGSALRRDDHDMYIACNPVSVPALPPLKYMLSASTGESLPGHTPNKPLASKPADLSVVQLPQLVAKVGPELATGQFTWMEGPCLTAAALGTDIPFKVIKHPQEIGSRPYELCVVPPSKAGPDHYIFSPTSVTHIQDGQSVGVWSLAGWYQEAVLWKALRDIPFFRSYLLRKGFMRWRRNIRRIVFRRRRDLLHTHMLIAVPQISHALLHFNRLLEELSRVCWIPQDESRTFTLLEFQTRLSKVSQESRGFLERFLHYRSLILTTVRDFSHSAYQELHQQVELSAQGQRGLPLHTQQASTRRLRQQLEQTGRVQHKLGRFAALVDHMIVQGLVTISRREITAFHTRVLKREQGAVGSVFQAELIFGEDSQLTVFPPLHLFQEALRGTLCSVHDSVLQVGEDLVSLSRLIMSFSEFDKTESFLTSDGRISSLKKPCVVSTSTLVLPKRISLQVQGKRLHMQYCALSRTQLEWHLQLHAGTQEVEKEQARITQEAFQEIHQLCESHSWLVDTYFFISQWRPASLESMRGWSALQYEEHVQKVQLWIERVRSMPPAFTTSNKLLTVNLSHIREKLEPMLNTIEEDALRFLSEELQLHSENLKSELKKVIESLKSEPTDFNGQTNYIGMVHGPVKFYKEKSVDMQAQLKFICSLQEIVQLNCRSSTPGKQPLVEQTHDLWNHFVPLLERAEEMVTRQLPSVVNMLDSTFSSLTEQVRELVSKATAGPTVGLMSATLTGMCKQLHDLSRTSKSLRGHPLDLTFVTRAKQTVEAQMGLWELLTMSSAQIREWKLLLFSKFVVSRSQEKVTKWLEQAAILAKVITSHNAVLQETLHTLESFNQQLSVLAKLSNPTVKHKHWTNIFKGMGLLYVPDQNLTVADLMTKGLWEHRDNITKICSDAQAEADMQWELHRLQRCWEGSTFRLAKLIFTLWHDNSPALGEAPRKKPDADLVSNQHSWDSGTFTIIEELLDLFERYQKKWVFLSKIFHETFVSTQNVDLVTVLAEVKGGLESAFEWKRIMKYRNSAIDKSGTSIKPSLQDPGLMSASTEVQARNLFVVAYIWSFGGHLHPRHWPQFDLLARKALLESRYKIEVPTQGTVFEHFFNFADTMLEDSTRVVDFTRNKGPKHSYTSVPQYGKCAYLMDLMLEAHQSVLLVGETGSGKTKLGKSLLSPPKIHVHLPVSPLLHPADLRSLLESIGRRKARLDFLGAIMQYPGLVLFLDDLHEAPFANVLTIARLWMHECFRTFGDRLSSDEECQKLVSILTQMSEENFGSSIVTECQTREDLSSPACQSKSRKADHISQSLHLKPVPQDMEESTISRKESVESPIAEGIESHSKQVEKSEWCSEEENSSDYSVSSSETEEDCYSSASSNRRKQEESDYDSASSTVTGNPQIPPSSPRDTKLWRSSTKVNQSMASQQVLNQSDVPTCKKPQDSSKMFLQLLLDSGSSIRNVVFSSDICGPSKTIAEHQFRCQFAYLERDMAVLVQQLAHIVANREEGDNCNSAPYAVYHQRVCQLTHVLRALLVPGGHGVLFRAAKKTGRKSTVRLAAYLTGYRIIEVHHRNEGKLKEMWKEAERHICLCGGHVVFLIHEDTSQAVRDELLVVMDTGTFPRHYTDEKLKVPNSGTLVNNTQCHLKYDQVLEKCFTNAQRNIHVFLLVPINRVAYERQAGQLASAVAHITKAVTLCCCVEVYQPWSSDTLVEIASRQIQITNIDIKVDATLVGSITQAMAGIHTSATAYASSLLNIHPFSPQTFIELIAYFCYLYDHLGEEGRGNTNRVATVVTRVKEMIATAQTYSEEVLRLEDQYENTQKVSPLYQAALKAIQSLSQSDLDEVRHYRRPPHGVVILMDSICMLFDRPCNWESCKQLLGKPGFLQELEFFDRSKVSDEMLQKLSEIVQSPNFQRCAVHSVSRACESLCCWVRAVYQYASVQRLMAPQKALKRRLARSMAESRARLREDRLQEEEERKRLEEMEEQREVIQNHLEELEAQVHKIKGQEEEATAAIQQVRFFTEKWSAALKETERNSQTLSGDALIVAAAVAYLGPFQPHIRLELLEKWQALCLTGQINLSPEDPRTSLFGGAQSSTDSLFEPIPVDPDLQRALARAVGLDHCAVQGVNPYLVLKLLLMGHSTPWAHCWALLTHTQQHEELSSHTLLLKGLFPGENGCSHKEDDYELVLSADDPELLDKLRHGAKTGLRVLVTHIEQAVPTKELVSMLARPAGSHFLEKVRPTAACHPAFRLVLSTPLPVHALLDEIHPLILEKVKVIDLSLSTSQVRDVILSDLLQSECSGLWVQHCQATRDKHTLQEKLQIEEASLMQYILKSVTPLLQDPGFLPQVSVCQNSSLLLQAQLEGLAAECDRHRPLLSSFHQRAAVATALYKALEEVQRLSPFYNFRLRDFLIALRQTLVLKGRPNVRSSRGAEGAETSVVVSEITHRVVSHLLAQYRPCLFQQHAELLRLLMSVSLMHEGCTEAERVTFLKGFSGIKFPQCASPPTECSDAELPNWISPHVHAEVCLLDRTSPFRGLVSSLRNSSRQWQEYLHFPSSTVVGPVPCQSHSHLTMLQRAILWKTLFPEWLAGVADDLAACQYGRTADGPHIGCSLNLLSSLLSRNKGPIIVHLPGQSTDRLGCVHPLHWIKQAAQYQADRKGQVKVTVLSFGSECQRDAVLSALDTAVQSGHWLVLNNCHLLDHWDAEVITQLKHLLSCTTRGLGADQGLVPDRDAADNRVHPDFRLWFITKGRNPLSVPAIVRIHALFLACDSHWDLKSELCCSLRHVLATARLAACPRRGTSTTEPLLRCAVLHSVLLQRQKLKSLGQGKMYNWSQEDLHSLAEAHLHIARHCTDPTGALEYIADAYLYEEDVLRGLEHCVLTTLNTLNITEAQALGFSEGMSSAMQKEKGRTLCVLLLKSQSTRRHADDLNHAEELSDYRRTLGRLWALREQMGGQAESHAVAEGTAWLGPLPAFLQTEWNLLRETLSSVLEGVSQPSQDLSASPYTISELEIRADLLRMYRQQGSNSSPQTYCLSAFTNPRGFLASLIRETICNKHRDASHVSLHFQVLEAAAVPSSVSSDGVYLCGLELHGALWDTRLRALHATLSPNPCALPLLWVRALVRDEHLSSPDNLHTSSSSMQLYNCPLYVHSQNKDGGWSLSEENIVTHIPLKTKLDPALCTLRRVRLVSTLKEKELSC